MQFQQDINPDVLLVKSYQPSCLVVAGESYTGSLILCPEKVDTDWHVADIDSLTDEHINQLCQQEAEIYLLGTGAQHKLLGAERLQAAYQKGYNIEVMSTAAAVRTYMILATEGRHIAAGLII